MHADGWGGFSVHLLRNSESSDCITCVGQFVFVISSILVLVKFKHDFGIRGEKYFGPNIDYYIRVLVVLRI